MELSPSQRAQRLCTLRTHESHYSSEDVLFNLDRFPGAIWDGDLAQIIPIKSGITSRDFMKPDGAESDVYGARMLMDEDGIMVGPSNLTTENWRAYTFVVRDAPQEIKDKDVNLKVCPFAARVHTPNIQSDLHLLDYCSCVRLQVWHKSCCSTGRLPRMLRDI
jgi:hypothetical protein